ncbi:MAG: CHRD domain-containing protein [Bacteroidota bacterium]
MNSHALVAQNLCLAEGGDLIFADDSSTVKIICADDGIPDPMTVLVDGEVGDNSIFLVTNNYGTILATSTSPDFDFEGTGSGSVFILNLAFDDGFTGDFSPGSNFCMFTPADGCFDLSRYVAVIRRTGDDCMMECTAEGGDLFLAGTQETEITICAGDDMSDAFSVDLSNTSGANMAFLITDLEGNILALPTGPEFDLDVAGPGVCLLWHISYEDDLSGLEVGANADDLEGCFSLSNFIQVNRISAEAGQIILAGGETDTTICLNNNPAPIDVIRTGDTEGDFFTFIITDDSLNILALPEGGGPFDLNSAGAGSCLIWYLASSGPIAGLEPGANAADLMGCLDLSNSITVVRNAPDGGEITFADGSTEATICAGDSIADPLEVLQIGTPEGGNFTFVITDTLGNILDIPAGTGPFDFEGAEAGVCLIWYLAFEDGLEGAMVGANASELMGCFDLSNPLTVIRNVGDDCPDDVCDLPNPPQISIDGQVLVETCYSEGLLQSLVVTTDSEIMADSFALIFTDAEGNALNIIRNSLGPVDVTTGGGFPAVDTSVTAVYQLFLVYYEAGVNLDTLLDFGCDLPCNLPVDALSGCFTVSNAISIAALNDEDCNGEERVFAGILSGTQEVPYPALSSGDGTITGRLIGNILVLSGEFSGLSSPLDTAILGGVHIHHALAGTNGDLIRIIDTDIDADFRGGFFTETQNIFPLNPQELAWLLNRELYVNIHSMDFPGGELRAQILVESESYHMTLLSGSNEVPSINSLGTGTIVFERDGNTLTASGSFTGLSGPIATDIVGGAHLHLATSGRNGPILFPLTLAIGPDDTSANIEAADNSFDLSDSQLDSLLMEMVYVNVHSTAFPSGELRGQVTPIASAAFRAGLAGHQQNPAVNSTADGRFTINFREGEITVSGSFNNLEGDLLESLANGAHLHLGLAGTNGPVAFPLNMEVATDLRSAELLPAGNTFPLTADQQAALFSRAMYVNVHSTSFPPGEIRGQVVPRTGMFFSGQLSGRNEVEPNTSTGGGHIFTELRNPQLITHGSFSGLTADFAAEIAGGSHLHVALANANGDIAVTLIPELAADLRSGNFLPDSNTVEAFILEPLTAGAIYTNIHTADFPAGELRAQLLRDDNAFPGVATIVEPMDSAEVIIMPGDTTPVIAEIIPTTDPNGDFVYNLAEVALVSDTFYSLPLLLENVGTTTFTSATFATVYDTLVAVGFPIGLAQEFRYRLGATDGSVITYGPDQIITVTLANEGLTEGVVINEITADGQIEIYNGNDFAINLEDFYLANSFGMYRIGDLAQTCGSTILNPEKYLVLDNFFGLNPADDELGLYQSSDLNQDMIAYLEWGSSGHSRAQQAIEAGLWSTDFSLSGPVTEQSLQYFPTVDGELQWLLADPTLCEVNSLSTSVEDPNAPGKLAVYPNPVSDLLFVETTAFNGQSSNLELLDINGRRLLYREFDFANGRIQLPLGQLPAGTYLLRLRSEDALRIQRIQIQP